MFLPACFITPVNAISSARRTIQNPTSVPAISKISLAISLAIMAVSCIEMAHAQSASEQPSANKNTPAKNSDKPLEKASVKTETIIVTASTGAYRSVRDGEKGSASAVAPTQASLDATQPQSIITREFIESAVAPTAEYSRVVNVAPSMSGDSANGPGLSETKTTMRGFSDDQYNITFDGIPWGDTNNPAHHSTSFFPASVIGGAVVERGPGNASNLGQATFGGSINLFSKKPKEGEAASVFASAGRWNTSLIGTSYESGKVAGWDDATLQLNYQHLQSDGYLTLNKISSDNLTIKFQRPVGESSTFTLFSSINQIKYRQPDNNKGPTLAQVAQFGRNFSLNNDPASFNFEGFNRTTKDTDFEYLRLQSEWENDWRTDAHAYTYAYNNQTISSTDPTGLTPPGTRIGTVGNKNIPGIDKQNKYRVYGSIVKATKQFSPGLLRFGLWWERSFTDRHQYNIDLTLNNIRDPRETKPTPIQNPSVLFDQQSQIKNFQPFIEFEWDITSTTLITPGIKRINITRLVDASVNQTTRTPLQASVDYKTTLPFLTLNQKIGDNLAVYAQYAKGYQIPDLKSFYIANPTNNSSDPQTSTNYQLGVVFKNKVFVFDADVYQINFNNKYVSNGQPSTAAAFINIGGATYKGVEAQLTALLSHGFALYANGSVNRATANDTGKQIANAPKMTAAAGVIYSKGAWNASLIHKRSGANYQQDFDASKPAAYDFYRLATYDNTDLGGSYTFRNVAAGVKALKLQFNIFNLLNNQKVTAISPGKTLAGDQYIYQAPRSYQLSMRLDF
jgi:iron complex outermembrane recepter protein